MCQDGCRKVKVRYNRNTADEEGDFETVAMFEDYVGYYSKNLWFVNSMVKQYKINKNRNKILLDQILP